ncbi:hypothetical protein ACFQE5_06675, partial [Pseudonocardia hispaniensis]
MAADRVGVVSHAGSRLVADVADRTTLTGQLSQALSAVQQRARARHDPGQRARLIEIRDNLIARTRCCT